MTLKKERKKKLSIKTSGDAIQAAVRGEVRKKIVKVVDKREKPSSPVRGKKR